MHKGNNQDFRRFVNGAKGRKVPARQPAMDNRSIMEHAMAAMAEKASEIVEPVKKYSREVAKLIPDVSAQLKDEVKELRERLEEYGADQQSADE